VVSQVVSLLVLTEDSGGDGYDTIFALFKKMVVEADHGCRTNILDPEPMQNAEARRALRANKWKSKSKLDQREIEVLRRTIATRLLEGGFVVFHVDGDRRWSGRESSENEAKFETLIRQPVQQVVASKLDDADRRASTMRRLLLLMPFYSIESWLYQNTRKAVALCNALHAGKDVELFEQWGAERSLLDEVLQPKEQTCLEAGHNLVLASSSFPAAEVWGRSPSFTASVDLIAECQELIRALCAP
jgi:hypothetical protein